MRTKGKVKSYNAERGFGFLDSEKGKIFFHINIAKRFGLSESDFKEGKEFDIEIEQGQKGLQVKKFLKKEKQMQIRSSRINTSGISKNFHLVLNKPHPTIEDLFFENELKNKQLGNRCKKLENFDFKGIDFKTLNQRNVNNIKSLFPNINDSIVLKPDWRLTLGLGGASIFETSITLHHIYGIPYISASGIKGVVRSYIIEEYFESDEVKAVECKSFCDIFGCSKEHIIHKGKGKKKSKERYKSYYGKNEPKKADRQGNIFFFDAYPTVKPTISMDIMNVHYKDYYGATKNKDGKYENVPPPADWSSPNIINFLTVKDSPFQFLIAAKDDSITDLKIKDKTITQWLTEALQNHGIGAKTAVGYGYMQ